MRANLLIWKRTTQTGGGKEVEGGKSGWENDGRWFGCAFFLANISGSVENGKYMFYEA